MRKIFLILLASLGGTMAHAQGCTPDNIGSAPGKWVNVYGTVDPKLKDMFAFVKKTFQDNLNWSPVGGDIFVGGYSSNDASQGSVKRPIPINEICGWYECSFYFMSFSCREGKILRDGEAIDAVHIEFNDLPFKFEKTFHQPKPGLTEQNADQDPGTDTYTFLNWLPEEKDGYLDYLDDEIDGTGTHPGSFMRYRILVKPGKLPYALMSKKEYYEKSRRWILGQIAIDNAQYAAIDSGSPGYADIMKQKDFLNGWYQKKIDGIDRILKERSAEELSKPAFQGEEEGEYFESRQASDHLRPYVVKPNMAYYDRKVPRQTPQLITLSISDCNVDCDDSKKQQGDNVIYAWDKNFHKPLMDMHFIDLFTAKLRPFMAK